MRMLDGIVVIELGSFITGPLAGSVLAEMGADVIKVERPEGDPFRQFDGGKYSPHFQAHNRNKRSVVIDYNTEAGIRAFRGLLARADVLLFNTRPGVMDKLGFSTARLRADFPSLVICAISGFGQTGPYAVRPAFDNVGQALSGWMSRFKVDGDPRVVGPAVSDAATGLYAASAILGALLERQRTGVARSIDISMLESTMALGLEPLGQYLVTGVVPPVFQRAAMSQAYSVTCADGRRIGLHLSSPDKFWEELCRAIERPDLMQRYPRRMDRVRHYETLAQTLNSVFAERTREEWLEALARSDVPFAPEHELNELATDPQIAHLAPFYTIDHPQMGPITGLHRPYRVDGSREIGFRPPPVLGEHTSEVFEEFGIAASEVRPEIPKAS
jgi:crotonobetainyl-CoA:carnitine CoA-transferase CaiB-like acyl-CoA transferase